MSPLRALLLVLPVTLASCVGMPVEVVAHRGASAVAPENTLAAIEAAIDSGAHAVEVDVRRTKDGELVLFHDADLDRTTDGSGPLADHTLAQLRRLDAGSWDSSRYAGERIPTLVEALRAADERVRLMLDIKVDGIGAELARVLGRAGVGRAVWLGVWTDENLAELREHLPRGRFLFIGEAPPQAGPEWIDAMRAKGYEGLSLAWKSVTPQLVARAQRIDLPLYVWTLDLPHEVRAAVEAGVTGIITNEPAILMEMLRPSIVKGPPDSPWNLKVGFRG